MKTTRAQQLISAHYSSGSLLSTHAELDTSLKLSGCLQSIGASLELKTTSISKNCQGFKDSDIALTELTELVWPLLSSPAQPSGAGERWQQDACF